MNLQMPPPSLEPTLYFFSNSLTVIAVAGLVFFLLGLWFGFLNWGRFKRRSRAFQEETNLLRLEIARLKRRISDEAISPAMPIAERMIQEVPVAQPPAEEPELAPVIEEESAAPVTLRSLIEPHSPVAEHPVSEVVESIEEPVDVPVPIAPAPEIIAEPVVAEVVGAPTPPTAPVAEATPAPLPVPVAVPEPPAPVSPPVIEVTPEPVAVTPLVAGPIEAAIPAAPEPEAPAAPVISELAGRVFASEFATGVVRGDPKLGVLYGARPDRWDDLTMMRGVAEITQHKLHDCGIYTFKQIAVWDDRTMREVGHAIHAGDRISRERWPQQARDLHYLKYGEKLG